MLRKVEVHLGTRHYLSVGGGGKAQYEVQRRKIFWSYRGLVKFLKVLGGRQKC